VPRRQGLSKCSLRKGGVRARKGRIELKGKGTKLVDPRLDSLFSQGKRSSSKGKEGDTSLVNAVMVVGSPSEEKPSTVTKPGEKVHWNPGRRKRASRPAIRRSKGNFVREQKTKPTKRAQTKTRKGIKKRDMARGGGKRPETAEEQEGQTGRNRE